MRYLDFNKILICVFIVTLSVVAPIRTTYAAAFSCATSTINYDEPDPRAIACPIIKILNVLVLSGGAVFVGMLFFSAFKFAMSQGDPKGVQGAKDTATLAVLGFIIVIGLFVIITFVKNAFGINTAVVNNANGPFDTFITGFQRLLNFANVNTP